MDGHEKRENTEKSRIYEKNILCTFELSMPMKRPKIIDFANLKHRKKYVWQQQQDQWWSERYHSVLFMFVNWKKCMQIICVYGSSQVQWWKMVFRIRIK